MLDYDLTSTTLVTVGDQSDGPGLEAVVMAACRAIRQAKTCGLPRETALMFPWNRWDFDTTEVFGSIEQRIGEGWTAKLNLTAQQARRAHQKSRCSSTGAVNPIDNRGPRLFGMGQSTIVQRPALGGGDAFRHFHPVWPAPGSFIPWA